MSEGRLANLLDTKLVTFCQLFEPLPPPRAADPPRAAELPRFFEGGGGTDIQVQLQTVSRRKLEARVTVCSQ